MYCVQIPLQRSYNSNIIHDRIRNNVPRIKFGHPSPPRYLVTLVDTDAIIKFISDTIYCPLKRVDKCVKQFAK